VQEPYYLEGQSNEELDLDDFIQQFSFLASDLIPNEIFFEHNEHSCFSFVVVSANSNSVAVFALCSRVIKETSEFSVYSKTKTRPLANCSTSTPGKQYST
jgi:hypothetical protein